MSNPSLVDILKENKIDLVPRFDGTWVKNGAQWFVGRVRKVRERDLSVAHFGDFRRLPSQKWISEANLTGEEKREVEEEIQNQMDEERAERERFWKETQILVKAEWETFLAEGISPYLTKKGFPKGLYGCRLEPHEYGARTIVPSRDVEGKLWGYQRIYSGVVNIGDKRLRQGARKKGCFHLLGEIKPKETIYFCEGISTALSVFQAFDEKIAVVSCFDANNLTPVAEALREKYPEAPFKFCADHDKYPSKDGQVYNTGQVQAERAAEAVGNSSIILPAFKEADLGSKPTDFNDMHVLYGLEEVRKQIEADETQKEKKKKPTKAVSETSFGISILLRHKGNLVRQDKSLFRYNGTHWEELEAWDIDQIKNEINSICRNQLDSKKVNSIYATFFRLVPHVPRDVNLFVPNPKCGNFLDGTLRLNREEKSGVYCLSFSAHRREDYLTWVIPVKFQCDRSLKNSRFELLLKEALEGEPDAEGMIRSLKQMGGAMLVPTFPQMFFLFGVSGSRKSTIVLSLAKLLASQNISAVDPANMKDFQIEGMIGKLVNMQTDIADDKPLPRGFLKNFEDDVTVQVNRKGKPVVKSKLPAVHIYCANNLPPNLEGSGLAFNRRLTLLQFKKDLTHGVREPGVIRRYEELVWADGYEGLLNFCVEGLTDLVQMGGKFFTPESSKTELAEWQLEHDPLGQFLEDLDHEELDGATRYSLRQDARITRKNLWAIFDIWQNSPGRSPVGWNRRTLCSAMRKKGFKPYHDGKERGWVGLEGIASGDTHTA